MAIEQGSQQPFALAIAEVEGCGAAQGSGSNPRVEIGSTGFQAHSHGGPIYLHQQVVWQIANGLKSHQ
jgi:hypothetical protein